MKQFLKVYLSTIILFTSLCIVFVSGYILINRDTFILPSLSQIMESIKNKQYENLTPFERAVKESSKINVLLVGKEHVRTDTIMLVSYDKNDKTVNILSIPRDTYYERDGYDNRQQKKINAIYQDEGIEGLINAVETITNIPIDNYVCVDYNAVIGVVDILGGIEVDVPFDMQYSDPQDTPPLIIDIKEGLQTLDGETALKYLRFRHNSDGTGYKNGDLDRIKAQQEFIKIAVKKALSLKLPAVINESFKYIDTDITLAEILNMATDLVGFSSDNIETDTIDYYTKTIDGLSYVIPNSDGIQEYVYKLYNVQDNSNIIIDITEDENISDTDNADTEQ